LYDLEANRKHYSQLVTAIGNVDPTNTRLITALTTVKREDYPGSGDSKILRNRWCIRRHSNEHWVK